MNPSNRLNVIAGCFIFIARPTKSPKNSGAGGVFTYVISMSNSFDTLRVSKTHSAPIAKRSQAAKLGVALIGVHQDAFNGSETISRLNTNNSPPSF